mmetsp:Transcript_39337/g.63868  ORF Transcript_39337/g.63868 Transcript_39337/m.63868 type:complete len:449 (-) Transcript_39337:54-1400(-)
MGSTDNLVDDLADCAAELMSNLRKSDRAINSAATRIRYDPERPVTSGKSSRMKQRMDRENEEIQKEVDELVGEVVEPGVSESESTDSFLEALKEEDDATLLRRWRSQHKQQLATFKQFLSGDEAPSDAEESNGYSSAGSFNSAPCACDCRKSQTRSTRRTKSRDRSSDRQKSRGGRRRVKSTGPPNSRGRSATRRERVSLVERQTRLARQRAEIVNRKNRLMHSGIPAKKKKRVPTTKRQKHATTRNSEAVEKERQLLKANEVLRRRLNESKERERKSKKEAEEAYQKIQELRKLLTNQRKRIARLEAENGTVSRRAQLQSELERTQRERDNMAKQLAASTKKINHVESLLRKKQKSPTRHSKPLSPRSASPPPPPPLNSSSSNIRDKILSDLFNFDEDESDEELSLSGGTGLGRSGLNTSSNSEPLKNQNAYERYKKLKNLYDEKYL